MLATGAALILVLNILSATASSDKPLLLELRDRYPKSNIWPQHVPCGDDCLVAAGGPFDIGRWRITDTECMREKETQVGFEPGWCLEHFNWSFGGIMHPRYNFEWLTDEFESDGETNWPVFVGDVSALFGRKSGSALYLVQREMFRPIYHLVEAATEDEIITKLTEYSLGCEKAPKNSWERSGYRHHTGYHDIFGIDYCEIRDLKGFRNLARKALRRAPAAIWERVGDLPQETADGEKEEGGK